MVKFPPVNLLTVMSAAAFMSGCVSQSLTKEDVELGKAVAEFNMKAAEIYARQASEPTAVVNCNAGCSVQLFDPSKTTSIPMLPMPVNAHDVSIATVNAGKEIIQSSILPVAGAVAASRIVKHIAENTGDGNIHTRNTTVNNGDSNTNSGTNDLSDYEQSDHARSTSYNAVDNSVSDSSDHSSHDSHDALTPVVTEKVVEVKPEVVTTEKVIETQPEVVIVPPTVVNPEIVNTQIEVVKPEVHIVGDE